MKKLQETPNPDAFLQRISRIFEFSSDLDRLLIGIPNNRIHVAFGMLSNICIDMIENEKERDADFEWILTSAHKWAQNLRGVIEKATEKTGSEFDEKSVEFIGNITRRFLKKNQKDPLIFTKLAALLRRFEDNCEFDLTDKDIFESLYEPEFISKWILLEIELFTLSFNQLLLDSSSFDPLPSIFIGSASSSTWASEITVQFEQWISRVEKNISSLRNPEVQTIFYECLYALMIDLCSKIHVEANRLAFREDEEILEIISSMEDFKTIPELHGPLKSILELLKDPNQDKLHSMIQNDLEDIHRQSMEIFRQNLWSEFQKQGIPMKKLQETPNPDAFLQRISRIFEFSSDLDRLLIGIPNNRIHVAFGMLSNICIDMIENEKERDADFEWILTSAHKWAQNLRGVIEKATEKTGSEFDEKSVEFIGSITKRFLKNVEGKVTAGENAPPLGYPPPYDIDGVYFRRVGSGGVVLPLKERNSGLGTYPISRSPSPSSSESSSPSPSPSPSPPPQMNGIQCVSCEHINHVQLLSFVSFFTCYNCSEVNTLLLNDKFMQRVCDPCGAVVLCRKNGLVHRCPRVQCRELAVAYNGNVCQRWLVDLFIAVFSALFYGDFICFLTLYFFVWCIKEFAKNSEIYDLRGLPDTHRFGTCSKCQNFIGFRDTPAPIQIRCLCRRLLGATHFVNETNKLKNRLFASFIFILCLFFVYCSNPDSRNAMFKSIICNMITFSLMACLDLYDCQSTPVVKTVH
uniref:PPDK_N domain-containing protein n=1 Tax=Caenorhabditis tropicalis TaxID=1561998 RepID=A0A1I7UFB0_9PELO